ncbi:MAG: hypothetical protein ACYCS7_06665 [Acidimicrobiales bacterium]
MKKPRIGWRHRGESGQLGGLEALVFGVMIFVLGTLVIANAWAVIDVKMQLAGAARQGVRAFIQAAPGSDPLAVATRAARMALVAQGGDPTRMVVSATGTLSRCNRVTLTVSYRVPLITVPLLGGFSHGFTDSARDSELVDPYRSGLPGEAVCGLN